MAILDNILDVLGNLGGSVTTFFLTIGNLVGWIEALVINFFFIILWALLIVILVALITSPIWIVNLINRVGEKYRNFNLGDLFIYSMKKVYTFFK